MNGPALINRQIILLTGIISCLLAIFIKGPSLDEYWTMLFADPRLDMGTAWQSWSADIAHPVGYYATMRLFSAVLPQTIAIGRAINLVPLAIFLWFALFAKSTKNIRQFTSTFAVVIIGSYYTIERFAEQRAYFSAFIALSLLVVATRSLFDRLIPSPEDPAARLDRGASTPRGSAPANAVAILLLSIIVALLDYPTLGAVLALLGASALSLFGAGRRREALWLVGAAMAATAVAVASLLNAFQYERVEAPYSVSMAEFAWNTVAVIVAGLLGNLVIAAAAGWAFLRRNPSGLVRRWLLQGDFASSLTIAVVVTVAGYAMINALSHALITRQLIGLVPLTAGATAAFFSHGAQGTRLRNLALLAMIATVGTVLFYLQQKPVFHRYAPLLAAEQRRCAAFRIFALDPEELSTGARKPVYLIQRQRALADGYKDISGRFGFSLSDPAERRFDNRCGGAVWMFHVWLKDGETASGLLRELGFSHVTPTQRASASLQYEDSALVILVPGVPENSRQEAPPEAAARR